MRIIQRIAIGGLAALLLLVNSRALWSQQPLPKRTPPQPAAVAPGAPPARNVAPSVAPVAAAGAKPAANADPSVGPSQTDLENNPALRSALEMQRKVPRDYVESILLLIDLGHPELAKPILADLIKLNVSDEQRAAMVNEFGSEGLLKLSQAKELGADAATFATACMAAASAAANNPERIAGLVKQLSDPSSNVRVAARNDLAATGQVGATAALEALARETDPARRASLIKAVELMHPLVNVPLLAMLETNDSQLRNDVTTLLHRLAVPQAAPFLSADTYSAERAVGAALSNYQRGTPPFAVDGDNQVEIWKWNDAAKKLTAMRVPADEAQTIWIARLADELARIRPDNSADQRRALVLRLEAAGLTAKPNAPPAIPRLPQADPHELSEALGQALKSNYSYAALALVDALSQQPDASILYTTDGKPSPLADALASPNRRVRFAALKAIMALNPAAPYPGSSRVPDTLAWFAGSSGEHQAVVAMPTNATAGDIAGKLAEHQLAAEAVNRGHEAVETAASMPDLELIFVDMNILAPEIREVIYQLRITPATGDVPIALLAADGRLDAAKRLASEHTRVIAVPRPHTPEAVMHIAEDLTKLSARDAVPADERAAQADQAKKWLTALSSGSRPFYTFRPFTLRTATAPPRPLAPPPTAVPVKETPAEAPAEEPMPNP
jgi:CheY-like chemotaxis protein